MIFVYLALNLDIFLKKYDFSEKLILSFFFEQDQGLLLLKINQRKLNPKMTANKRTDKKVEGRTKRS